METFGSTQNFQEPDYQYQWLWIPSEKLICEWGISTWNLMQDPHSQAKRGGLSLFVVVILFYSVEIWSRFEESRFIFMVEGYNPECCLPQVDSAFWVQSDTYCAALKCLAKNQGQRFCTYHLRNLNWIWKTRKNRSKDCGIWMETPRSVSKTIRGENRKRDTEAEKEKIKLHNEG